MNIPLEQKIKIETLNIVLDALLESDLNLNTLREHMDTSTPLQQSSPILATLTHSIHADNDNISKDVLADIVINLYSKSQAIAAQRCIALLEIQEKQQRIEELTEQTRHLVSSESDKLNNFLWNK